MLETLRIRGYGQESVTILPVQAISRKPEAVDNHYVAGFVDGEGTFHVAFQRNPTVRLVWQIVPEFHLSQNECSRSVLEEIQERLGCGNIKANHQGSSNDRTHVLVVRNRQDLLTKVIPFFERYPLHTEKRNDFATFKVIVEMMNRGEHLERSGFERIVHLAYSMNARGTRRRVPKRDILRDLESSETIRQKPAKAG